MDKDDDRILEDSGSDDSDVIESEQNDMETEVEDADADTRDVERDFNAEFSTLMDRLGNLEKMVETLSGSIAAIRDAQSVMIDNGAVIQDVEPLVSDEDVDDFRSISELDLTL